MKMVRGPVLLPTDPDIIGARIRIRKIASEPDCFCITHPTGPGQLFKIVQLIQRGTEPETLGESLSMQ